MAGPLPWSLSTFAYGTANQAVTGSTELVVVTLTGVNSRGFGSNINLNGWIVDTTGTTTTAVVIRVRQDSLTGSVVGVAETSTIIGAAGSTDPYTIEVQDSSAAEYANKTYVLTVQHTGGGTGGSVVASALSAVF